VTFSTIKHCLKEHHWVWKRCRHRLKSKQNPAAFEEGQRVLNSLQTKEMAGEIDLFYLDESGFSTMSVSLTRGNNKGKHSLYPRMLQAA
jgi:hypothetical protein